MGRKHWEKEKLLVMSNFSFSRSVFKGLVLQTRKNQGLFGKGLNHDKTSTFCSNTAQLKMNNSIAHLSSGEKYFLIRKGKCTIRLHIICSLILIYIVGKRSMCHTYQPKDALLRNIKLPYTSQN